MSRVTVAAVSTVMVAGGAMPALATAATAETAELNEIVVTAERRESTAQKSAIAIDVIDAEQLAAKGIREARDLNGIETGVQVYPIQNQVMVAVRGVGSSNLDPRSDPTVSVALDNIPFSKPTSSGGAFFDLERIEVLKGPQGTLYGRNSAAGALNIVTAKPTRSFASYISGTAGNFSLGSVEGMLNVPVGETLALRGAVKVNSRDGYIADYYNDDKSAAARLSAQWNPSDRLSVYAMGNFGAIGGHGHTFIYSPRGGVQPWSLDAPNPAGTAIIPGAIPKDATLNKHDANGQVRIDYKFGAATLTAVSGYVYQQTDSYVPNGAYVSATGFGSPEANKARDTPVAGAIVGGFRTILHSSGRTVSQEVRIAGNDDAHHAGGWQWLLGAFYLKDSGKYQFWAPVPTSPTSNFPSVTGESTALFGQATIGISDRLRLTAGARSTHDDKGYTNENYATKATSAFKASFSQPTFKATLEYDLRPASLLFFDISTGYIAGGLNQGNPAIADTPNHIPFAFRAQKITAYQVGSKNRFLENRLQANAELFYYDYTDYQYTNPGIMNDGSFGVGVVNLPSVKSYGAELNLAYAASSSDTFTAQLAYLHARVPAGSYPGTDTTRTNALIVSGPEAPMINSPTGSAVLGYTHRFSLASGQHVELVLNGKTSGSYTMALYDSKPENAQGAFSTFDVSIGWSSADDKLSAQLWGRNLGEEAVRVNAISATGFLYAILPPRTFGLTIKKSF